MGKLLSLSRGIELSLLSRFGRWVQEVSQALDTAEEFGTPFLMQTDWFVDPVNGSDTNDGATANTALRTLPELARRWAGRPLSPTITDATITLAAGTYPDPLTLQPILPLPTQSVTVRGTTTQVGQGTVTAFTAWSSATGVRCVFTDTSTDFSATLKARIRMTSGVAADAMSWYNSVAAPNSAQPNSFTRTTPVLSSTLTPAIGDTYTLETLATSVPGGVVQGAGAGAVLIESVKFTSSATIPRNEFAMGGGLTRMRLSGCHFDTSGGIHVMNAVATLAACMLDGSNGTSWLTGTGMALQCFSSFGSGFVQLGSGYFTGNNIMHDGNGTTSGGVLVVQNGAALEDIGTQAGHCFFGCVGGSTLVELTDFGRWVLNNANCRFWGAAGNTATVALKVFNGSGFTYVTLPTATGVVPGNDVVLSNAAAAAWATMPAIAAGAGNNAYVSVRQ